MTTKRFGVWCGLWLLGCAQTSAGGAAPEPTEPTEPSPGVESAAEPAGSGGPEGTERLAARLGARHTRDLPTPEQLRAYPDAAASLRWIAEHDPRMIARARALGLLRYDDSAATRTLLLSVLDDPSAHPSLRAAAIVGTRGLAMDPELDARLDRALEDPDPRVRHAARARRGVDGDPASGGATSP